MKTYARRSVLIMLLIAGSIATAAAQGLGPGPPPPKPQIPVKIQVTIARYEGDKKVSSLPYILAVTANNNQGVSVRMGSEVPVPSGPDNITYRNVGTQIDCSVSTTEENRFQVRVQINDSSIMERRNVDTPPTLRSFTSSNTVLLKDGQSSQFTAAADKLTGEVVRVDVTLTVEK